ncbi:Polymyxin resistance protein ArnT, undecaprenyl phosphate-alpha-L-Ara4N transferase; Melittin resistance protein PqaB [plant metagenome]
MPERRTDRWLLLLAALVGARLLLMIWLPLADTSEPRYAEIARIMAVTGDWITPWFEPGTPFWGKPPLAFWASAASFKLLGMTAFAARLPALLATLATLGLVHALGRHLFDRQVARRAVLVLASCILVYVSAGAVLTDAYLALAVTLSLTSFVLAPVHPSALWRYGGFVGLAIGLLAKGPLAVVLVFAVLLPWTLWHGTLGRHVRAIPWLPGLMLTAVLALPWYVMAEMKTPGFLNYFIIGEHFSRFLDAGWQGDRYGTAHDQPHGRIWLEWLFATLPWSPVAIWLACRGKAWRHTARLGRRGDSRLTLLALWALFTPAFFTFSGNILWTYVLPALPAFALWVAWGLSSRKETRRERPVANTAIRPSREPVVLRALPLFMAAVALALTAISAAKPDLLKSEGTLVQAYARSAASAQPLVYVDSRPFSARFYSHGQARLAGLADVPALLARSTAGLFIAVPKDRQTDLAGTLGRPLPEPAAMNRRYVLYFLDGTAARAPAPAAS